MSLTSKDLQSIANLLDEKLKPIEERLTAVENEVKYISVTQLENNIIPRLNTIEKCYVKASNEFMKRAEQIDTIQQDVDVLKQVVGEHSQQLQQIS